jgi:uncharacterized protein (DUF2147 family)
MQKHALKFTFCFAVLAGAGPAHAASSPIGIWIDHTGRGAVEITECGANLCGRLVWLKDGANKKACGTQIIGNAKPVGKDTWDGGWIYDPEKNEKYSVELKPIGADKLRVLGYMGSKLFSETMIWKRPTTDLERCDAGSNATASPTPSDKKPPIPDDKAAPPAASAKAGKAAPPANPTPVGNAAAPKQRDAKGKSARETGKEASKPLDCKRYVPQIGETISVPCEK